MEQSNGLEIVLVSGACCSPSLRRQDQKLEKNLQQAVEQLGIVAAVKKVSLSDLLGDPHVLPEKQQEQVLALFREYGTGFTPAVLVAGEVRFAGDVPSVEQLKETLGA